MEAISAFTYITVTRKGRRQISMAPSSSARTAAGAGTLKTLEKLEKSVEAGNYYEAQQMYKTIYARYMASKKYTEALDLLQSGACIQLRHGQLTCGVELGLLLIEAFCTSKLQFSDSSLDRIKAIYEEFPRGSRPKLEAPSNDETSSEELAAAKTRVEGVQTFLKAAIKWSSEFGGPSRGSPELHDLLAVYTWTQSPHPDLVKVSQHFVRGSRPDAFASAIVEAMSQCQPDERDILLARGVLLYLSMGNMRDANKLLEGVESLLKTSSSSDVLASPLTHFIRFILLTLERDALPLFRMLRENYKSNLERDHLLNELLDVIAEKFYGVRRKNGLQNMFGDLMKMFVEGGAETF